MPQGVNSVALLGMTYKPVRTTNRTSVEMIYEKQNKVYDQGKDFGDNGMWVGLLSVHILTAALPSWALMIHHAPASVYWLFLDLGELAEIGTAVACTALGPASVVKLRPTERQRL